jgi:hypothetical protein
VIPFLGGCRLAETDRTVWNEGSLQRHVGVQLASAFGDLLVAFAGGVQVDERGPQATLSSHVAE